MKKILNILIVLLFSISYNAKGENIGGMNFTLTGNMFYNLLLSRNENDLDRFGIENVRADVAGGLKFFNRKNVAGLSFIRINSDNTIYELSMYKFFINYFVPAFKIQFFYGYRIENYNDGFRLLDDEIESFYQPIIFYRDKKLSRLGYWGKDYTGIRVSMKKFVLQDLILAKKTGFDAENKFSVISRTVKEFIASNDTKFFTALNLIYIKQDYTLPEVNSSSWAEYDGVWYEFNTNSFYDVDNDYKIKATGEVGIKLANMINIWGEAGVDNKYGGYYGETTQKATSSGNTNYVMILKSAGYKKFIFGGGVKLDVEHLALDVSYRGIDEEYEEFTTVSNNLILSNKNIGINNINVKLRMDFDIIKSVIGVQLVSSVDASHNVYFDKYNFLKNISMAVTNVMRIRSFNKINLGTVNIYPEIEYSKYDNNLNTVEINGGVGIKLFSKLNFYGNIRYKMYNVNSTNNSFINPFLSIRYSYNRKIYFEFGYGLDNRLLYDNEYGFEYYLNNYISTKGDYNIDNILNAEEAIMKNNYIFITGNIGF